MLAVSNKWTVTDSLQKLQGVTYINETAEAKIPNSSQSHPSVMEKAFGEVGWEDDSILTVDQKLDHLYTYKESLTDGQEVNNVSFTAWLLAFLMQTIQRTKT